MGTHDRARSATYTTHNSWLVVRTRNQKPVQLSLWNCEATVTASSAVRLGVPSSQIVTGYNNKKLLEIYFVVTPLHNDLLHGLATHRPAIYFVFDRSSRQDFMLSSRESGPM